MSVPATRPAAARLDPWSPVLLAAGLAALFWTHRVYRTVPPPPFPRASGDFRSAAQLDAAAQDAEAALRENPENTNALIRLVLADFERGPARYKEALKNLEKARDLGALDERLFYYAGVMYDAENLPDFAVPELERFLRRRPEDLETRLRLGNLYYRLDDLDRSAEAYRRVLERKPGDALVSFNLAFVLRDRKNWVEALDALKPFTDGGRSLPTGGHKLLGDIYRGLGQSERALAEYEAERTASGDGAELAAAMAQAYEDAGRSAEAVERWERLTRLDPKNREARAALRRLKKRLAASAR